MGCCLNVISIVKSRSNWIAAFVQSVSGSCVLVHSLFKDFHSSQISSIPGPSSSLRCSIQCWFFVDFHRSILLSNSSKTSVDLKSWILVSAELIGSLRLPKWNIIFPWSPHFETWEWKTGYQWNYISFTCHQILVILFLANYCQPLVKSEARQISHLLILFGPWLQQTNTFWSSKGKYRILFENGVLCLLIPKTKFLWQK